MTIRTTVDTLTHHAKDQVGSRARTSHRLSLRALVRKFHTKRFVRYGLFAANAALVLAAVGFVMQSPSSNQIVKQSSLAGNVETVNPLDQLSSSDVAVHLARMSNLPEATAVANQADTISGQLALSSSDNKVVAKPQIVSTDVKSYQDIQVYVTQPGDTVESIAAKFGVTSDSIVWSNDLGRGGLEPNRQLYIPPVNGIVYLVKAGDTPEKLAADFNADKEAVIAFNDAEVRGLVVGQRIAVPGGSKVSSVYNIANRGRSSGGAWGGAVYSGNAYDRGWCTWYAANRRAEMGSPVPSNWGNANTWDNYARTSGWTVSDVPVRGAVAQTDARGWGHVGIVEEVSADGTMIKYSDMNGLAGWGRRGDSDWVPVHSKFQRFIYR